MKRLSNVKSTKKATKRPRQTGNAQPTENDASSDFDGDSISAVVERRSPPQHPTAPESAASTPVRCREGSGCTYCTVYACMQLVT